MYGASTRRPNSLGVGIGQAFERTRDGKESGLTGDGSQRPADEQKPERAALRHQ